jgi:hypothetical protein
MPMLEDDNAKQKASGSACGFDITYILIDR